MVSNQSATALIPYQQPLMFNGTKSLQSRSGLNRLNDTLSIFLFYSAFIIWSYICSVYQTQVATHLPLTAAFANAAWAHIHFFILQTAWHTGATWIFYKSYHWEMWSHVQLKWFHSRVLCSVFHSIYLSFCLVNRLWWESMKVMVKW